VNAGLLLLELIPLLIVGCLGPGLLIVRPFKWSPLEKLCGAIAASLIVSYLVSFVLFCANVGAVWYWAASAVFLMMGIRGWPQLRVMLRFRRSRSALIGFGIVVGWEFLHLALSRHLGGGRWEGDWNEHYDRMMYFMHKLSGGDHYLFLYRYTLPARPPMMNVLSAFYCQEVGRQFEAFSLVFLALNALAYLPCCLLLGQMGGRSGRNIRYLTVLFMLNASILENATYGWTKALTAGMVVMGVCFYLRAIQKTSLSRMCAAMVILAAAVLVHYSAIPFCAAIAVHYAIVLVRGRAKISHGLLGGLLAILLLSTWFGWSFARFGVRGTLLANTTAAGTENKTIGGNLAKIAYNTFTTLVPYPMNFEQPFFGGGDVRNNFFMVAQTTLPVMVGTAGGLVAALLIAQFFMAKGERICEQKIFWAIFLLVGFFLGIAANGEREASGAAHVTLQTLGLMGVTLVAARIPNLNLGLFWFLVLGIVVDYALGIFLNFDQRATIYPPVGDPQQWMINLLNGSRGITGREYAIKLEGHYTFWGDYFASISAGLELASIVLAVAALYKLMSWRNEDLDDLAARKVVASKGRRSKGLKK
jgi:hypothetical protein